MLGVLLSLVVIYGFILWAITKQKPLLAFFSSVYIFGVAIGITIALDIACHIIARPFSRTAAWEVIQFLIGVAVIIVYTKLFWQLQKATEKEVSEFLPKLRDFTDDFSHFLPKCTRVVSIYKDPKTHSIKISMIAFDAKWAKEHLEWIDELSESEYISRTATFFGSYTPSKEEHYCMSLLSLGDVDGETVTFETTFLWPKYDSFYFLMKDTKKRFPHAFKKGSDTWFDLRFSKE